MHSRRALWMREVERKKDTRVQTQQALFTSQSEQEAPSAEDHVDVSTCKTEGFVPYNSVKTLETSVCEKENQLFF